MKYVFATLCFVVFLPLFAISQNTPPKFGVISRDELEMKYYSKDSSAEAVVLYDFGDYTYTFNNEIHHVYYTFHKKIKILKKAGLNWATIQIPYFVDKIENENERVRAIEGVTYNLQNGNIITTKLDKSAIYEEKTSGKQNTIKIAFPQAKEGSIIEYSYTIDSPHWYYLRTWNFQEEIPVAWSELKVMIPGYFDYKLTYFGYNSFFRKDVQQGTGFFFSHSDILGKSIQDPYIAYDFVIKDLSAIKSDDYTTTINDYRSSINFELARTIFPRSGEKTYSVTYKDLTKTLLNEYKYGLALKKFSKTAEKISENIRMQSLEKDTLSLVNKAYEHIRNTVKWNEENSLFTEKEKLEQIYEKQLGNCSEINLMLVAILQEMGFEANPVILSTRSHGVLLPDIALIDRFNYTIAQVIVNGKDYLLDATDPYVKPNMLPKRCLNSQGWLLSKNPRWVSLIPVERKQTTTLFTFTIEEEQKLIGKIAESYSGYAGTEKVAEINKLGKEKYLEKLKNEYLNFENPKFSSEITTNNAKIECETTINEAYSIAGDRIFLQPLLWKTVEKNPFKDAERKYPVDLAYRTQDVIVGKYIIPKNYSVESLPANQSLVLADSKGKFSYIIKVENNVIEIMSQITLSKTIYAPDDYGNLREFFNKIISKQNEQIVLKKNN